MIALPMLLLAARANELRDGGLPSSWLRKWFTPPAEDRPLQIIHGIPPSGSKPAGMGQIVPAAEGDHSVAASMRAYGELGLGGVVCNVLFDDYLRSEPAWEALKEAVRACCDEGMVVWIYDEKGYPSGSAGGLVLEGNPEYEAQELAYDPSRPDPFIVRPSYEFTHAANNYHAARRYPNLLNEQAVRKFLTLTHQAYRRRLGTFMGSTVRAFFTDEPSLLAVNLGQIPEPARSRVPVVDPPDPNAKPLPAVPWVEDLPERYQERYGQDLMAVRRSLFEGDMEEDKTVRRRFWTLVGDLLAERYFGTIQKWCREARVYSSGHNLWEEALMHHPALYGNALKALMRMDIPGMDELSSNPAVVLHGHWMTAAMPASAAMLTGRRRVFTEVSDFSETMAGKGPVDLQRMQATAAWQAAFGVTDFTLYYSIQSRSADDYRAYCAFVGRLNAILKPARLAPDVLLYYPIYDLTAEYRPVAEPLHISSQSAIAQRIVASFNRLGTALTRAQIPFCLADHETLGTASVLRGRLTIHRRGFRAVVLPDGVTLPPKVKNVLDRFRDSGGVVLVDGNPRNLDSAALRREIRPQYQLDPPCDHIVVGQFRRDSRAVLALVNVTEQPYIGAISGVRGPCYLLEPATGAVSPISVTGARVRLELQPFQTVLLTFP